MNVKRVTGFDRDYLEKVLREKGWSYYRLAKETGISQSSISRLKTGLCSRWHAHVIAKTLGIEESRLLRDEPAKVSGFQAYATIAAIAKLLGVSPQTAFRHIEMEYEKKKKNDRD